jgi:hypothetical protein
MQEQQTLSDLLPIQTLPASAPEADLRPRTFGSAKCCQRQPRLLRHPHRGSRGLALPPKILQPRVGGEGGAVVLD